MKIVEVTNKVVRHSDPKPKLSKPVTGREQKNPYTGMLVGSAGNPHIGKFLIKTDDPNRDEKNQQIAILPDKEKAEELAKKISDRDQRNTKGHVPVINYFVEPIKESTEVFLITEEQFDEAAGEKDACYHKVKSRYKVLPSAYASGALVKCRKVGAKNWGNSSKKKK